jgi:hypothetical protein
VRDPARGLAVYRDILRLPLLVFDIAATHAEVAAWGGNTLALMAEGRPGGAAA